MDYIIDYEKPKKGRYLTPFLIGCLVGLFIYIFIPPPQKVNAALNETACAALVSANIKAENPDADVARITPYWKAVCKGIIDHIKSSAIVTVTIPGGSSAGAAPGVIQ